jgi:hypothetical protein
MGAQDNEATTSWWRQLDSTPTTRRGCRTNGLRRWNRSISPGACLSSPRGSHGPLPVNPGVWPSYKPRAAEAADVRNLASPSPHTTPRLKTR